MTAVADARAELYEALQTVTSSTWRVHQYAPATIAAPVIFIDSPSIGTPTPGLVSVTFPVVMVVDGSVRAQLEQLDELLARVWTAAERVGVVRNSNPASLDVGGPSLRAQVITVENTVAAVTMCPPTLIETARS
jgi:hypothetical protein